MKTRVLFDAQWNRRRRRLASFGVVLLLGTLLDLPGLRAGVSIFDDGYVPRNPPKTAETAPAETPTTAEPPASAPATTQPTTNPAPDLLKGSDASPPASVLTPPASASSASSRQPVPDPTDRADSAKHFKKEFAVELGRRSSVARRALAIKLLEKGDAANSSADRFVLLQDAIRAGREGSDLPTCCRAAERLAEHFDVDALHLETEAAINMSLHSTSPSATDDNCIEAFKVVDRLVDAEQYALAAEVVTAMRRANPSAPFLTRIRDRAKEIDALRAAAVRVGPYIQKLKTAPEEPQANLQVGQYLCLVREDWKAGLPLLAKGPDSDLTAAAALELAAGGDPERTLEVGDTWWALAAKEAGTRQDPIRQHAAMCYFIAINSGKIPESKRLLPEKRILSVPPSRLSAPKVISARWGGGSNWADVTPKVRELVGAGDVFWANCGTLGADPTPGWRKHLEIVYNKYGIQKTLGVDEDQDIQSSSFAK